MSTNDNWFFSEFVAGGFSACGSLPQKHFDRGRFGCAAESVNNNDKTKFECAWRAFRSSVQVLSVLRELWGRTAYQYAAEIPKHRQRVPVCCRSTQAEEPLSVIHQSWRHQRGHSLFKVMCPACHESFSWSSVMACARLDRWNGLVRTIWQKIQSKEKQNTLFEQTAWKQHNIETKRSFGATTWKEHYVKVEQSLSSPRLETA